MMTLRKSELERIRQERKRREREELEELAAQMKMEFWFNFWDQFWKYFFYASLVMFVFWLVTLL